MGRVRIGTCSWADRTMIEAWYPREVSSAEGRLRYYAERFDTVEADSPYYGIPTTTVTANWAERTPAGFRFHVKAYGLMTGHTVDERSLPAEARDGSRHSVSERGRVFAADDAIVEQVFGAFSSALEPIREQDKLGGILMQYPPSFAARDDFELACGLRRIARDRELLSPDHMMVEFRHASWLEDARRERVLRFLADEGITFVVVDAPRMPMGDPTAVPVLAAVTAPTAYVRFQGRNARTWHITAGSASDRFDYLYSQSELAEWEAPLRDLASQADTVYAMFNNCRYDYAPRNGHELARILGHVSERPDGSMPGEPAPAAEDSELRLDV